MERKCSTRGSPTVHGGVASDKLDGDIVVGGVAVMCDGVMA